MWDDVIVVIYLPSLIFTFSSFRYDAKKLNKHPVVQGQVKKNQRNSVTFFRTSILTRRFPPEKEMPRKRRGDWRGNFEILVDLLSICADDKKLRPFFGFQMGTNLPCQPRVWRIIFLPKIEKCFRILLLFFTKPLVLLKINVHILFSRVVVGKVDS